MAFDSLAFDSMRQISDSLRIITRNPSIHDFYPGAFIERPPNKHGILLLRTLCIHSPLLRLENAFGLTLFTNSFSHLHFLSFYELVLPLNVLLCSLRIDACFLK